jgi:mono/diheme cytochrome c family protein
MMKFPTIVSAGALAASMLLPQLASAETTAPANETSTPAADQPTVEVDMEAMMTTGRGGFVSNCSSCHGTNGEGDLGPSLVGNDILADAGTVTDTIINGFSYMPPFGDMLNDQQVAAIATYIRNAWGNEFGPVSVEEAAAER